MLDLTEILKETSHRRIIEAPKPASNLTLKKKQSSACDSECFSIEIILEEAMSKHGVNLLERNIVNLVREFNSNDISGTLRSTIRKLKKRLRTGVDQPEIQMVLRIILRSKEKMLQKQQGSNPGTPASSDDDDEEDSEEDEKRYIPTSTPPSSDSEDDEKM